MPIGWRWKRFPLALLSESDRGHVQLADFPFHYFPFCSESPLILILQMEDRGSGDQET